MRASSLRAAPAERISPENAREKAHRTERALEPSDLAAEREDRSGAKLCAAAHSVSCALHTKIANDYEDVWQKRTCVTFSFCRGEGPDYVPRPSRW